MIQDRHIVLILEGDAQMRLKLEELLTPNGFEVKVYKTPKEFFSEGPPACACCLLLGQSFRSGATAQDVHAEIRKRTWHIPCIVVSSDWSVRSVVTMLRAGAEGYLAKPVDPEDLLYEVTRALKKSARMNANEKDVAEIKSRARQLSRRESSIVTLVLAGHLNKEIAAKLGLALVTVKAHRARAMKKLGAGNAAELARIGLLAGLSGASTSQTGPLNGAASEYGDEVA